MRYTKNGGSIHFNKSIDEVKEDGSLKCGTEAISPASKTVLTTPLPVCSSLLKNSCDQAYIDSLGKTQYIGNVCLTLELSRSLSEIYWLNVNDPGFPFVGIIEHTNFELKESYKGRHIVYLSKYLPTDEMLYNMSESEFYEYHLQNFVLLNLARFSVPAQPNSISQLDLNRAMNSLC